MAQGGLEVPGVGMMLDHAGNLRPVMGISSSFTVGSVVLQGVISAACGESFCVAKTDNRVVAGDVEIAAPAGPAFISIQDREVLLYFVQTRQFARLREGRMEMLDWAVEGTVIGLSAEQIVVRRDNGVWLVSTDGSVLASLPEDTIAASAMVHATPGEIVVERADGSQVRLPLEAVVSLSQLGPHFVLVSTGDATYALRIDGGREEISLLPEAAL